MVGETEIQSQQVVTPGYPALGYFTADGIWTQIPLAPKPEVCRTLFSVVRSGSGYRLGSLRASEHMLSFLPDPGPAAPRFGALRVCRVGLALR